MPPKFQIIEVPADVQREQEQMGTKFKFWYLDKQHGYCLFKEGHPNTGEDWAERIAAELCELLEMPHAVYKLAVWQNRNGIITPNFIGNNDTLVPGNEVLFRRDASYPKHQKKTKKHSIENIFNTFEPLKVQLPIEPAPQNIATAQQVFLGYLMLDAWIGNTDRHHENWALIRRFENGVLSDRLAPTHDHASSLGAILRDIERRERLTTKDRNRTIEAYVAKGRSAIFGNETDTKPLSLIEAFQAASRHNPDASKIWLEKLHGVTIGTLREIFERVPEERISETAKEFALRLLAVNRRRLLELEQP
ncbi:MAG: HipA-like protein [Acidobacteria bacterium]|nr:HipA-like protein [Acidobacteriota bacterium]